MQVCKYVRAKGIRSEGEDLSVSFPFFLIPWTILKADKRNIVRSIYGVSLCIQSPPVLLKPK